MSIKKSQEFKNSVDSLLNVLHGFDAYKTSEVKGLENTDAFASANIGFNNSGITNEPGVAAKKEVA